MQTLNMNSKGGWYQISHYHSIMWVVLQRSLFLCTSACMYQSVRHHTECRLGIKPKVGTASPLFCNWTNDTWCLLLARKQIATYVSSLHKIPLLFQEHCLNQRDRIWESAEPTCQGHHRGGGRTVDPACRGKQRFTFGRRRWTRVY